MTHNILFIQTHHSFCVAQCTYMYYRLHLHGMWYKNLVYMATYSKPVIVHSCKYVLPLYCTHLGVILCILVCMWSNCAIKIKITSQQYILAMYCRYIICTCIQPIFCIYTCTISLLGQKHITLYEYGANNWHKYRRQCGYRKCIWFCLTTCIHMVYSVSQCVCISVSLKPRKAYPNWQYSLICN